MVENVDAQIKLTQKQLEEAKDVQEALSSSILHSMVITLNEDKLRLLNTVKDLKQQLIQQKEDQADVYFYLNKKCDESYDTIRKLESQMITEQVDREIAEKAFEKTINDLKATIESNETNFLIERKKLEEKIISVQDYIKNKEQYDQETFKYHELIEENRLKYEKELKAIEARLLDDREAMKIDYERMTAAKVENARREYESKAANNSSEQKQLNEQLQSKLRFQSDKANDVLTLSKGVMDKDRVLRRELELAHATEKELLRRIEDYKRVIHHLNERLVSEFNTYESTLRERDAIIHEKDVLLDELEDSLNRASSQSSLLKKSHDDVWNFLSSKYDSLQQEEEQESLEMSSRSWTRSYRSNTSSIDSPSQVTYEEDDDDFVDQVQTSDEEKLLVRLLCAMIKKYPSRFLDVVKRQVRKQRPKASSPSTSRTLPQISSPIISISAYKKSTPLTVDDDRNVDMTRMTFQTSRGGEDQSVVSDLDEMSTSTLTASEMSSPSLDTNISTVLRQTRVKARAAKTLQASGHFDDLFASLSSPYRPPPPRQVVTKLVPNQLQAHNIKKKNKILEESAFSILGQSLINDR